jgi:hypothetical protein
MAGFEQSRGGNQITKFMIPVTARIEVYISFGQELADIR